MAAEDLATAVALLAKGGASVPVEHLTGPR